jgi:hypothetical protein
MKQFLLGFAVASALGVGALWAQSTGRLEIFEPVDEVGPDEPAAVLELAVGADKDDTDSRRGKRRKSRRGRRGNRVQSLAGPGYETGDGVSGDDLGGPGARELSMGNAGGEEQLSEAEIDRGIDRVFNGIERCLVLVPAGAPATGKVVVGMHIAPNGQVMGVNLKGPNTIVSGEAGACIRRIVNSIRYPSFDGPDMLANYPIVFE